MLGVLVTVHLADGWVFTAPNGGWEHPLHPFALCVAQGLLGDGAVALAPSRALGRTGASAPALPI